jgi:predicted AlkP superfamily phosphohydrolase/phosphomutase/tetratricopeptide (TPR) repeat protein
MSERLAKKVLLIGWDAADWKLINPLLDKGWMPSLNGLIEGGVMGNLATLRPILSPMLWNSIATGKLADKHGIHGFVEPDPQTGATRPVSSISRKVKAIWNILMQRGLRSHVLGWYAGHPAEPINGVYVSPLFALPTAPLDQPWPLPEGSIHPASLRDTLSELRIHPAEMTQEEILPFIPRAAEVDQDKDGHLASLARILAENCSIHNAATWILENEEWDFMAVYYSGIDHFCHAFMSFYPPRLEGVAEEKFEIYKDVMVGAYRFHDMMLKTLLDLAGPDATVILASDHGFHSDHLRPRYQPKEAAGPAVWHRPIGIFCMKGPHIRKDERIYGANLLDITPTILTLFGLPVGEDMDGRVLMQAFEHPPAIETVPSWETERGECGMHPSELRMEPESAKAVLDQLVALGYIEPLDENKAKSAERAVRESKYNLARVYASSHRPLEAIPLLQQISAEDPERIQYAVQLAQAYMDAKRLPEARSVLESLMHRGSRPWTDWLMGVLLQEEGKQEEALVYLRRAEEAEPRLPDLHIRLGNSYLRTRRWDDAGRAFQRAIEIDGDSAVGHLGVAMVELRRRHFESAAAEALAAVGLQHLFPAGHFYLGVALARLEQYERAILAFETAVFMMPGMLNAHRWLGALYARPGGNIAKAHEHRQRARDLRSRRAAAA